MQKKYKLALAITPSLFLLDQASKSFIRDVLFPWKPVTVVPGLLEFNCAENPGIAFSLLQDLPPAWRIPFFGAIAFIALLIILNLLRLAPEIQERIMALPPTSHRCPISKRTLRPIAVIPDFERQRMEFNQKFSDDYSLRPW